MHITLSTTELRSALEVACRVSTRHVTLPVLQCVLLEAHDQKLVVRATNLELGVEYTCAATISEEGVIAVPAQTLLQTISLTTDSTLTLHTQGETLHITSKNSESELKSMPADEFPSLPTVTGTTFSIDPSLFALGIKTCAFAASQSSIKPELGSIYIFQKQEQTLTFVATDSFRLVEKTVSQKGVILPHSLLIPAKNALEIARIAESLPKEVVCEVSENQCALRSASLYITSRLITGTFPDYEQIIPKEYQANITLLVSDLTHALKKTSIFLNKFQQLSLTISQGSVTVSAESHESGSTTESIKAVTEGGELTLSFNQRYLTDILPHVVDDSIILKVAGIGRPLVIQNVHDHSLRYLVMPMNK
jgi:DNA polymerase-3 subunit beta